MAHGISQVYRGDKEPDPSDFLDEIFALRMTRSLPGFVFKNTTYESHHFWIDFHGYKRDDESTAPEWQMDFSRQVIIRVRHGGGWEVWRGDYFLARILARIPDDMAAFWLCWHAIDNHRNAYDAGVRDASASYQKAFVDGRLKKRKMPGRDAMKVWIEPSRPVRAVTA